MISENARKVLEGVQGLAKELEGLGVLGVLKPENKGNFCPHCGSPIKKEDASGLS